MEEGRFMDDMAGKYKIFQGLISVNADDTFKKIGLRIDDAKLWRP